MKDISIISELQLLARRQIDGLLAIPSERSQLVWHGILFVSTGYYAGGCFRFVLKLSETFPDTSVPQLYFSPAILHPRVNSSSGLFNLSDSFYLWNPTSNHLYEIFEFCLKCLTDVHHGLSNSKVIENEPLAELALTDIDVQFSQLAKATVQTSLASLKDPPDVEDDHFINVELDQSNNLTNEQLDGLKSSIVSTFEKTHLPVPDTPDVQSFSWMCHHSFEPFAKIM